MHVEQLAQRVLASPPRLGAVRVVAVDGGAGSGKTTFAHALALELRRRGSDVAVLSTDLLLEGWDGEFTYWDRLREQVLDPLAAGRPAVAARYDWERGRFEGTLEVPVVDVLVVEGVSAVAACGGRAALTVWLELDRAARERRWAGRDGVPVQPQWRRWLDAEDAFFAEHPVHADVVVPAGEDEPAAGSDGAGTGAAAIRRTGGRTVYRSAWMQVREDDVVFPDGSTGTYGLVVKTDFALVVAAERGGFWLVQQYRYPVGSRQWEFPQGGWPEGHGGSPEELAAAELREETGFTAGRWEHLGRLFAAYGYSPQAFDVYLASDLVAGPPRREASEQDMVHRWFPEAQVRQMLADGVFADAHSVAALTLLDARRRSSGAADPARPPTPGR